VADAQRSSAGARGALLALLALLVAATLLGGCGGSAEDDPFEGFWIGGGAAGMKLVHIVRDGDAYKVFANPDYEAPAPTMKGEALVVDTHAATMSFLPAGTDKLTMDLSGDAFDAPEQTELKRVSETQYADAAVGFGLGSIQRGLAMWKEGGGKKYPPASEVTPTGMLSQMVSWPTNLFTGEPMQPRESKGDYTYKLVAGGKQYSLVGYLSDGSTVGK
jgi:hypothetical protein